MPKSLAGLLMLTLACFVPRVPTSAMNAGTLPPDFMFKQWDVSSSAPTGRYLGKFKVTYYWAVDETEYPESQSSAIYLADGSLLGRFSSAFVRAFKIEAAAQLRDGRRISYMKLANRAELVDRFLGCGGHKLTELKSIAVDPRIVPLGSTVYIPQAGGVMVNGRPQSGVFYANDIGSAIKGKRIDIFVGRRQNMDAFSSAGMPSMGSVDVYILE
jgi:3D (Asp-Asp-Asp) domain-containing protein